jgi:glycosyltransferase involved in cell wall biosynthesis
MDPTLGAKARLVFGGIEWMLGAMFSDRLICVSRDEYDHALSLGIPRSSLRVVVNGVAPLPSGNHDSIRARFDVHPGDILYGFIGRLSAQKAPERLVEAFARISARQPNARLLMIGDGELAGGIRARIEAAGLGDKVHLDASVPGPVAVEAFDILVMPSRYEAMSYVALEAAAAGKPMVLTDVGGASTVLEHGRNGLIVPNSDDPTALAEAMAQAGEPERLREFTAEAKRRQNRYTLSAMADETEEIYFDLLGNRAPSPLRTAKNALEFKA